MAQLMGFSKYITRFYQFGGMRLVCQYAKLGALWPAIKKAVECFLKVQSFKGIYTEILRIIEPYLIKKYNPIIRQFKGLKIIETQHEHPKIVWWCWLQGYDSAPSIVKACLQSLKKLDNYHFGVIDSKNWKEYVELPKFVVDKWEKGQIPAALFSDLLRLELLIKYGGTWIDSTVLYTGCSDTIIKDYQLLDADLFLFQYTKPGSVPASISNWFISSCQNNDMLIVLREMLYAYWRDYDCVLDYYIFHLFFALISKEYPEQIVEMPFGQSQKSLVLLHHLGDTFDQNKWDKLTSHVCFHKLAFRLDKSITDNPANYYSKIVREYGDIQYKS